jgi:Ca2+-binding RTX toxin-like protein
MPRARAVPNRIQECTMSDFAPVRASSASPQGTSADAAAVAMAEKQAALLEAEKEPRDLSEILGAEKDDDAESVRGDAADASSRPSAATATLEAAASTAAAIPIVGPIIAAILAAIAAVIVLIGQVVQQAHEDAAAAKDKEAPPSDTTNDGGDGDRTEIAAQAADEAIVTNLDWFFDPPGNDFVGGSETKVEKHDDGSATIWGSSSDDTVKAPGSNATKFDDTIYGGLGADMLEGGDGSDTIYGGAGDDTIWGDHKDDAHAGAGDYLYGGAGYDTIYGGGGDDYIFAGEDGAKAYGQDGNDWMFGGDGAETFFGNDGDDHLLGYAGNDVFDGGDGADTLQGGDDQDTLTGGAGDDLIFGGDGLDTIAGGIGDDMIDAGAGKDTVFAGADHDTILGGSGDDDLYGEAGNDTIQGGLGADYIDGGSGQDVFVYADALEFGDEIDGVDTAQGTSDKFDFSQIFNGALADAQQAIAGGYLQWLQAGADTLVQIDANGGGDGFVTAATLIDTDAAKVGAYMFIV